MPMSLSCFMGAALFQSSNLQSPFFFLGHYGAQNCGWDGVINLATPQELA